MNVLLMTSVLGEVTTKTSVWQTAAPFEIAMLAAGTLLTLGILGVFIFVLTRKESK